MRFGLSQDDLLGRQPQWTWCRGLKRLIRFDKLFLTSGKNLYSGYQPEEVYVCERGRGVLLCSKLSPIIWCVPASEGS